MWCETDESVRSRWVTAPVGSHHPFHSAFVWMAVPCLQVCLCRDFGYTLLCTSAVSRRANICCLKQHEHMQV